MAVKLCEPVDNDETVRVATPDEIVPVPSVVVPSLNVTTPEGADPVTVAVNTVAPPKVVGFVPDVRAVVEFDLVIVCVKADEVLVTLFVSPP